MFSGRRLGRPQCGAEAALGGGESGFGLGAGEVEFVHDDGGADGAGIVEEVGSFVVWDGGDGGDDAAGAVY